MAYKLRNRNAVGMMASSPLYETPGSPNLGEVNYGDPTEALNYQSKLRGRMKQNPSGYFEYDANIGQGSKIYDRQFYSPDKKGAPRLNPGYEMSYEKGLTYNAPKTKDKPKDLSKDPITQNIKKKEQSTGYGGTVGSKGSIGKLPKTGNLQVQDWGNVRDTSIGHGDKKATGDQRLMKGPYEFVNTGKGKLNVPKPKTTDKKASVDATSLVPKGGFGGGGTGKRIGNTDALNFDPTKFGLNKDGSTKTKTTSTSKKTKPQQKLQIDRIAPRPITNTRPEQVGTGPKNIASKMANVIGNATNANYDMIANKPASGRRQRIQRRLQKRQQNLEGRIANRADRPLIKQDRADAKELRQQTRQKGRESASQERKNLMTDMPVDKDATGGRKSSQPKTGSQDFTGMKGDKPRQNQGFDYSKGGKSKRSKKKAQRGHEAQKYGI